MHFHFAIFTYSPINIVKDVLENKHGMFLQFLIKPTLLNIWNIRKTKTDIPCVIINNKNNFNMLKKKKKGKYEERRTDLQKTLKMEKELRQL